MEADALQHVLVTEYGAGAGIGWHRDKAVFGEIVGISLLGSARMRLRRYPHVAGTRGRSLAVELAPRSIYSLAGEARWGWQHSIVATKALRYSITFRTLRRAKVLSSSALRGVVLKGVEFATIWKELLALSIYAAAVLARSWKLPESFADLIQNHTHLERLLTAGTAAQAPAFSKRTSGCFSCSSSKVRPCSSRTVTTPEGSSSNTALSE